MAALLVGGCADFEPGLKTGSTSPLKPLAGSVCPVVESERVSGSQPPAEVLRAFEACVSRYTSNAEHRQAATWIRDWYTAAHCLHECDAEGIGRVAHVSMWRGLRYIAAISLPVSGDVSEQCLGAQRAMIAALDERMSHFVAWPAFSRPQCTSAARIKALERQFAETANYRDRLTNKIVGFQDYGQ